MNEVIDAMKKRRSVRKFKSNMPPKSDIEQIIEAGLYAASGKNMQSAKIIAITDKTLRDEISALNCKIGGWDKGFDPFYNAPVILLVIADKSFPTSIYDGSLVMGNLMLAAHSLGLGSIWIHRAKEECETPEIKKLLADLGIEGEWEGVGHCAVGYADVDTSKILERKPDRVYWVE